MWSVLNCPFSECLIGARLRGGLHALQLIPHLYLEPPNNGHVWDPAILSFVERLICPLSNYIGKSPFGILLSFVRRLFLLIIRSVLYRSFHCT